MGTIVCLPQRLITAPLSNLKLTPIFVFFTALNKKKNNNNTKKLSTLNSAKNNVNLTSRSLHIVIKKSKNSSNLEPTPNNYLNENRNENLTSINAIVNNNLNSQEINKLEVNFTINSFDNNDRVLINTPNNKKCYFPAIVETQPLNLSTVAANNITSIPAFNNFATTNNSEEHVIFFLTFFYNL